MANAHGDFIWYELLTADADAAGDFYGKVIGWTSKSAGAPGIDYRFFFAGDGSDTKDGVGGYMTITPDMAAGGARPTWLGYIAVDDVDASVASIVAAGGTVQMPAFDLGHVGRMAMVTDGQGVPFYVMRGASDETSYSFAANEPKVGHCAWNELSTTDAAAAVAFYTKQFGWRQEGEMDMGAMGKYQFLCHGPGMIGAIMPKMPSMPAAWTYYFRVADIDVAVAAIAANGGKLLQEPMEIPGGDFAMNAMDPQGAAFALVGARK
ncbi:MAG: VOC family protein [Sphingopyxis sp.]